MKKKLYCILLSLAIAVTMMPMATMPAFAADSGTKANPWQIGKESAADVTAWLSEDGKTLTIEGQGTGTMQDFEHYRQPWADAVEKITTVVIGSGVKHIGDWAFEECENVANLYIDSIESYCGITFGNLDSSPFYSSTVNSSKQKLFVGNVETPKDLVIPVGVDTVPDYAFCDWDMLTSVEMPSVTTIGDYAFISCTNLTSVKMPSVTSIGDYAFDHCAYLTSVEMPSVTTIGMDAFKECYNESTGLTSVDIGSSITGTLMSTFEDCTKLESVVIRAETPPKMVDAFDRCDALTEIIVPNESVEDYKAADGWKTYKDKIIGAYVVDTDIEGQGTVTASPSYVAAADYVPDSKTITLTVTPDEGYELDTLTVTKADGGTVAVTSNSFKMPNSAVTVTATFKEKAEEGHTVTIKSVKHGSYVVMVNGKKVKNGAKIAKGKVVTVKPIAAFGYKLKTLTYNDGNKNHTIYPDLFGVYTFKMPAKNVTIKATFEKNMGYKPVPKYNPFQFQVSVLKTACEVLGFVGSLLKAWHK